MFQEMPDEDRSRILGVKVTKADALKSKQPAKRDADKAKRSPAPQANAAETNSPDKPDADVRCNSNPERYSYSFIILGREIL